MPPKRDPSLYPSTLDGEDVRGVVPFGGGAPVLDGCVITRGWEWQLGRDPGQSDHQQHSDLGRYASRWKASAGQMPR